MLAYHIELTKHATTLLLGTACLAVDLFFVLSGFVIGHAYESRLPQRFSASADSCASG